MIDIIIKCPTIYIWNEVQKETFKRGGEWGTGEKTIRSKNAWNSYKKNTYIAIRHNQKKMYRGSTNFLDINAGTTIIDHKQYIKKKPKHQIFNI